MDDSTATIDSLKAIAKRFCEERDWDQYHSPKELAIGVVTEGSELLSHFRFKTEDQMNEMMRDPKIREEISDEVADALYFILRLSQKYDLDLAQAVERKTAKNELKYPVDKVKGLNKKYTEY